MRKVRLVGYREKQEEKAERKRYIESRKILNCLMEGLDEGLAEFEHEKAERIESFNRATIKPKEIKYYAADVHIKAGLRGGNFASQVYYYEDKSVDEIKTDIIAKSSHHRTVEIIGIREISLKEYIKREGEKYFIAKCKHGYTENRNTYVIKHIPIKAVDRKAAAAIARTAPRVAKDYKFAIIDVYEVSREEYRKQIEINNNDRFFTEKITAEQNGDEVHTDVPKEEMYRAGTNKNKKKYDDDYIEERVFVKVNKKTKAFKSFKKAKEAIFYSETEALEENGLDEIN